METAEINVPSALSGKERLEAYRDRRLPRPALAELIGATLVDIVDGETRFTLAPRAELENGNGQLHGGIAATMLDTALGAAIQTLLPPGKASVTINLNLTYQRPLSIGSGTIEAVGRVTRLGSRYGFAEGHVVDERGDICAAANATFAIVGSGS